MAVADVVAEVTDTKWIQKSTRKQIQISRAAKSSHGAKLVKIADKIANLRDIIASPPAAWTIARKRQYFEWAKNVVDRLRGTNARLEGRFDALYRHAPTPPGSGAGSTTTVDPEAGTAGTRVFDSSDQP